MLNEVALSPGSFPETDDRGRNCSFAVMTTPEVCYQGPDAAIVASLCRVSCEGVGPTAPPPPPLPPDEVSPEGSQDSDYRRLHLDHGPDPPPFLEVEYWTLGGAWAAGEGVLRPWGVCVGLY